MTENSDARYTAADYRVRLFLSVDLSGSTAYKNSQPGEERERASPKWVTTFETFYRDFPARFINNYTNVKNASSGEDACPSLWKAVGDELVFCGRVNNKKSVMTALMAFIQTLHEYRRIFSEEKIQLNVKGAAWLAAFPEPNRAIQLGNWSSGESFLTASEALEAAADAQPFEYDFLGKAIDTGFRVSSFAKPEKFALSVQLARLLVSCPDGTGFDHSVRFDQPIVLKGVNGGEAYPVLYIDTMAHLPVEHIRLRERALLRQPETPSKQEMNTYLACYCDVVGTDEIALPLNASDQPVNPPQSYLAHRGRISAHLGAEQGREPEEMLQENGEDDARYGADGEIPVGEELTSLP